ncbi:MAG: S24 family peptidase [Bacteroidales bacterium]
MKKHINRSSMLKNIRDHYGFTTDTDFARHLEIKPQTLFSWYARNSFDVYLIYNKFPKISPHWLLSGEGELHTSKMRDDNNMQNLPLLSYTDLSSSNWEDIRNSEVYHTGTYVIPEFKQKGVDFLIRIHGDSMAPFYANGDILACKQLMDSSFFQWGHVYALETEQGLVVKRLYKCAESKEYVVCASENEAKYPRFSLPLNAVNKVAITLGVLCSP